MPCEGCACTFTVFRRKRSCSDCKRFYCNSCLSAARRNLLCERCAIFAKRPLLRTDLLQLKPKDLIFFLQSKHISTAGCVEKDELVGLVMTHIQQAEASSPGSSNGSGSSRSGAEPANSFDSLKQTCQNFFSNITDNISDSFASLDGKNSSKTQQNNNSSSQRSGGTSDGATHIFDQPRVSTREIPTYASFQTCERPQQSEIPSWTQTTSIPPSTCDGSTSPDASNLKSNSHSSSTTSPLISSNSSSSVSQLPARNERYLAAILQEGKSDCECSDDEIFTGFSELVSTREKHSPQEKLNGEQGLDIQPTGASLSSSNAAQSCKQESCSSKEALGEDEAEESSHSSFEELGAIGGISDESKAATDTNSGTTEQWQMLDAQRVPTEPEKVAVVESERSVDIEMLQVVALVVDPVPTQPPVVPQRMRKVTRRRSDTYLNRRRPLSDDESPTSSDYAQRSIAGALTLVREQAEDDVGDVGSRGHEAPRQRINCKRCGKNKSNIRRYVEKMRCHLESSQMTEVDIKRELGEFLAYLEKRTLSLDCSDTETAASSLSGAANCAQIEFVVSESPLSPPSAFDDNEGIHVYAAPSDYTATRDFSRFINLEDYESLKELECLSVKQLKEVLMLNRVDYKGCCEKQELLDRVERLWKNLKSTPAIDKLQTDELCKICMDAPIECIILECGHMATCTNCGKVLSECPICRQYIVRVVRFFRA